MPVKYPEPTVPGEAAKAKRLLNDYRKRGKLRKARRAAEKAVKRAEAKFEKLDGRLKWMDSELIRIVRGVPVTAYWSTNVSSDRGLKDLHARSLTSPRHGHTYANARNRGESYGVSLGWFGDWTPFGGMSDKCFGAGWTKREAEQAVLEWVAFGTAPKEERWKEPERATKERATKET